MILPLGPEHRAKLVELLRATVEFSAEEVDVALEIIDACLGGDADYRVRVDIDDEGDAAGERRLRGYICYGPTPMTEATYDLYWLAVDPALKGRGVGRGLVAYMEAEIARSGGRLVRVETERSAAYAATCAFYDAMAYERAATICGFYAEGRDLVIYVRHL